MDKAKKQTHEMQLCSAIIPLNQQHSPIRLFFLACLDPRIVFVGKMPEVHLHVWFHSEPGANMSMHKAYESCKVGPPR